jgi:hypothetical protein
MRYSKCGCRNCRNNPKKQESQYDPFKKQTVYRWWVKISNKGWVFTWAPTQQEAIHKIETKRKTRILEIRPCYEGEPKPNKYRRNISDEELEHLKQQAKLGDEEAEKDIIQYLVESGQKCAFAGDAAEIGRCYESDNARDYFYCADCGKLLCTDHRYMDITCEVCNVPFCCLSTPTARRDPTECPQEGEDSWVCKEDVLRCSACEMAGCPKEIVNCDNCGDLVCVGTTMFDQATMPVFIGQGSHLFDELEESGLIDMNGRATVFCSRKCVKCGKNYCLDPPCAKRITKCRIDSCINNICDECQTYGRCGMCREEEYELPRTRVVSEEERIYEYGEEDDETVCRICFGSGRQGDRRCPNCEGEGTQYAAEICQACEGSGWDESGETCRPCAGTGRADYELEYEPDYRADFESEDELDYYELD